MRRNWKKKSRKLISKNYWIFPYYTTRRQFFILMLIIYSTVNYFFKIVSFPTNESLKKMKLMERYPHGFSWIFLSLSKKNGMRIISLNIYFQRHKKISRERKVTFTLYKYYCNMKIIYQRKMKTQWSKTFMWTKKIGALVPLNLSTCFLII